jgi:hypothetical protein
MFAVGMKLDSRLIKFEQRYKNIFWELTFDGTGMYFFNRQTKKLDSAMNRGHHIEI